MLVDVFAHRSFHAQVKEKGEHVPLASLKLLKADPAAVQAQSEEIKARYSKIFGGVGGDHEPGRRRDQAPRNSTGLKL